MNKRTAKAQLSKLVDLKSLPKNKARVEIAKDVIAALNLEKLRAAHTYFSGKFKKTFESGASLRNELASNIKQCDVCAIGACFTAVVARDNKFDLNMGHEDDITGCVEIWYSEMFDSQLTKYFPREMLSRIEAAFECNAFPVSGGRELYAEQAFGDQYSKANDRMFAIVQNIISNDGEFIP